jgi:hypothetical protein
MTKGTARAKTNLKPTAGGVAIAELPVDGWVYGTKGATDLTGFDHYYLANGTRVKLSAMCKATLGNLILSNEEEPINPPPDPEPDPDPIDPPVPMGAPDQLLARWKTGVDASGNITWTEHFVYNRETA